MELVKDFLNSDDVSRMMPGKKDYVTIRNKEGKIQVQKRLVFANLKEIYQLAYLKKNSQHSKMVFQNFVSFGRRIAS